MNIMTVEEGFGINIDSTYPYFKLLSKIEYLQERYKPK